MRTFDYALALLISLAAAVPANADVLFSTIHTPLTPNSTRIEWPNTGTSGSVVRGGPLAESFYAPVATSINSVSLRLNANTPSDGGSVLVFIAPDTGLGGVGVASSPTFTGSGPTLAMTGAIQLGSIADSLFVHIVGGRIANVQHKSTYRGRRVLAWGRKYPWDRRHSIHREMGVRHHSIYHWNRHDRPVGLLAGWCRWLPGVRSAGNVFGHTVFHCRDNSGSEQSLHR